MNSSATSNLPTEVLQDPELIYKSRSTLLTTVPEDGCGLEWTTSHLLKDIAPGLNKSSESPNYYGFVTGGSTPAASFADNLVTQYDQNVAVHLPSETIATDVEHAALRMLCTLLNFPEDQWKYRTFTTGATGSNILGLACGREFVIQERARQQGKTISIAEDGINNALRDLNLDGIQILTTVPHSSLRKAASILGLGRSCIKDVGRLGDPHRFDLAGMEKMMSDHSRAFIVSISCAEVNTGLFATTRRDMDEIHRLCRLHGAWLHVDAAFGLLARALPSGKEEFREILNGVDGIELADSITSDGHKLFNVPYDCGIFLSRHLQVGIQVFQNTNAAYLDTKPSGNNGGEVIPSPLNIGIENSRRFRALPVYATLVAYGKRGHCEMLERQILLSREIARMIDQSPEYELLPLPVGNVGTEERLKHIFMIVLFRAKNEDINRELVARINRTRKIYVSGTQWDGKPAARFAVSNWQVDIECDVAMVKEVLTSVVK